MKEPGKKPFYGWAITGIGVLGNALQGGLIFWSMGLYTSTFEDHFNAPRSKITLIETFISVGANSLSPLIGIWIDKGSARLLMTLGIAAIGSGLVLLSFAGTLIHVWVVFIVLIPFGILAIGVLPSSALIARWFRRRRGLALGVAATGSSIGGAVAPPLMTWMFMVYGWRTALLVTGLVVITIAPVVYKVLANYPEDMGLEAEPEPATGGQAMSERDKLDWSVGQLIRCPALWLQTLVSGSLLCVTLGLLANLSLHAKDLGFTGQSTAALYSIIAICSFVGKISFGTLTDKIGLKPTGLLTIGLMASGLTVLLYAQSYSGLVAGCFIIGSATGGVTPIWTTMIARGFGARSFGRAIGLQNPLHIPITGPSAPLAGYISDTTGSYDLMFMVYIGLMFVAAAALCILKPPVHPSEKLKNESQAI